MKVMVYLLIALITLAGCAPSTAERGTDADGDAPEEQNLQACDQAIPYQTLIDAVPEDAAGFAARSEPQGSTVTFTNPEDGAQLKYSTATFNLADGPESASTQYVNVEIMDTCFISGLSGLWGTFYEYDSSSGSASRVTIAGNPAWKIHDKGSDVHSLFTVVEGRIIVSVSGTQGASESSVRAIAESIDYAALAQAAE